MMFETNDFVAFHKALEMVLKQMEDERADNATALFELDEQDNCSIQISVKLLPKEGE